MKNVAQGELEVQTKRHAPITLQMLARFGVMRLPGFGQASCSFHEIYD